MDSQENSAPSAPLNPSFDCEEEDEKTLSLTSQIICDILKENQRGENDTGNEAQLNEESQSDVPELRKTFNRKGIIWTGQICHPTSPVNDMRCRLLRQISENILTGIPIETELRDECTNNVLAYLEGTPEDIRTTIATYLSSGKIDEIHITTENLHYFFHVAKSLCLQQLKMHCFAFCSVGQQDKILECFRSCKSCREIIAMESETGYERSLSMLSDPDNETSLPEFYICFSAKASGKGKKSMAIVVDISQKKEIFQCKLAKSQTFDKGFRCCSCDVKHSPYIFVSGGMSKSSQLMWKYDVIMDSWQKVPKMHQGRSKHVMVSVQDERIFVFGGKEVDSIEEYNIKEKTWTVKGSLPVHVHSAVGISHGNYIFIFGGRTSAGPVATVQRFSLESNKVDELENLPVTFKCGQTVAIGEYIYIATGQGHLICFDPSTGSSHLCAQQPVLKKHFGMFVKDKRIYLVGGTPTEEQDDGKEEMPQYRYSPEKDQWTKKPNMCKCFPVYSSCIIKYPQKCSIVPFHGM